MQSEKPETKMISTSKSNKPQKFFERFLDNDLEKISLDLQKRYQAIESAKYPNVTPVGEKDVAWKDSNSVSTMRWKQYNAFQFYTKEVYSLYLAVSSMVREACEYYEIDFDKQKFMTQAWFNINHAKGGKLDWHEHGNGGAPSFHGYYSISAEPSETHYLAFDEYKINVNKNNRAVLSEMGHPHAMGDWNWDGPRITLAYDVIPLEDLIRHSNLSNFEIEQHWIPLA
jgi:hypothetical protein